MKAKDALILIAVSIPSLIAGYALGYLLFARAIIGDSQWAREAIGDLAVQAGCCLPPLVIAGTVLGCMGILSHRWVPTSLSTRAAFMVIACFWAGLLAYAPLQYVLMFLAAF
jgi:hypothetical protein